MPMLPNCQPNPYMEPPGFVVPHTHLHLMDYRRMLNPQYYQTMAYHSRRFRYQHNSQNREMTTSEVQTEPLSANQRTSAPGSSDAEASGGLLVCGSKPSAHSSQTVSPAEATDHLVELKETVPHSTARAAPNGSFVIQTEEVRIECCTTPVGLQLLHSHETAEVSHSFSQEGQRSPVPQGTVGGKGAPADQSEQALQVCPDILLVGAPGCGERIPAPEEGSPAVNTLAALGDVQETSATSRSRVIKLPFDAKYLDELRRMESTVWSLEETLIASPGFQSDHSESCGEKLASVGERLSAEAATLRADAPVEEMGAVAPELEARVTAVDGSRDEAMPEADLCPVMDVPTPEEATTAQSANAAAVADAPYLLLLDKSPLKDDELQHRRETIVQDHQDTSFESLPAYLPSTSWLADSDNSQYFGKLPLSPKKQSRPTSSHTSDVPSRRRKLELEYKEQPAVREPKERYKPKGKVDRRSLSDHECCLGRTYNENAFTTSVKKDRLCTRCLAKRRTCVPASPGPSGWTGARRSLPFQQRNETLLQTCESCECHPGRQKIRKGSSADVCERRRGPDTEGESSENGSSRMATKWRLADDPRKLGNLNRPLASKQNLLTLPTAAYPKMREKQCVCTEPQRQPVAWARRRHCPHGNVIQALDENSAMPVSLQEKWRNMDQIFLMTHRCQTGN